MDFSGCERYIDTPVKRYSSGMTVRLGFAIAAHLEPEILVVDEVLAVGDAEFQKKAIGKMQDVSKGGGRTVLFVSHNMAAVRSLCKSGIVLENGHISYTGTSESAISYYLNAGELTKDKKIKENVEWVKSGIEIKSIRINDTENARSIIRNSQDKLNLNIVGHSIHHLQTDISLTFVNEDEQPLASYSYCDNQGKLFEMNGDFNIDVNLRIPKTIYKGLIKVNLHFHQPNVEFFVKAPQCCFLECEGFVNHFGQNMLQKKSGLFQIENY